MAHFLIVQSSNRSQVHTIDNNDVSGILRLSALCLVEDNPSCNIHCSCCRRYQQLKAHVINNCWITFGTSKSRIEWSKRNHLCRHFLIMHSHQLRSNLVQSCSDVSWKWVYFLQKDYVIWVISSWKCVHDNFRFTFRSSDNNTSAECVLIWVGSTCYQNR